MFQRPQVDPAFSLYVRHVRRYYRHVLLLLLLLLPLQVDRAFSLYCTIDPLAQTLGINIYQFNQLIRDTDMADKTVSGVGAGEQGRIYHDMLK